MSDLYHQNINTVASDKVPNPYTLASAATIAPNTFLTFVTGTVQVATITPPVSGAHMLAFVFTHATPGALLTSGNIHSAYTPIQNKVLFVVYDPTTAKYYPHAVT